VTKELFVIDGWVCEAGCIDMGLGHRNPRAIGAVIEISGQPDVEIRGISQNSARELGKNLRGRVRIRIDLLEEADEQ
jgi:hypothetical protein